MKILFRHWPLLHLGLIMLPIIGAAQNFQARDFKFERLSVEQGLSQCTVGAIYQDRRGFLWIGTSDGLNRYDGYGFKHYKHAPADSGSLSQNGVTMIAEDGLGRLWIGTAEGGINRYDRERDRFIRYQHNPRDPQSLSHNHIEFIFEDSFETLWIGTRGGGLNTFDRKTEKFFHYRHVPGNPHSLSGDNPNGMFEDQAKTLWIFTRETLSRFDRRTGTFQHVMVVTNLDEGISTIYEDRTGVFWIATLRRGLKIFDRQKEKIIQTYRYDPRDSTTIGGDRMTAICEDRSGTLWIAMEKNVNRFDRATGKFLRFRHDSKNPNSLGQGTCMRIYCDRAGLLWIATDGSGLNKLDPRPRKFAHIQHEPGNANSLSNDLPKAICEDRFGDLWIGQVWGKLDRLNRRTEKFTHYQNDPNNPRSLSADAILAIHEDRTGDLWVGGGGGLNRFDRVGETFVNYRNDAGKRLGMTSDVVNAIAEDHDGNLWLGGDGLRKYDKRAGKTTWYFHQADNRNSLSHNSITAICADQKGTLWAGTMNGLNKIDRATQTFTRYLNDPANPHSLGHNYIKTIFEDRDGKLWIGTADGLNKFDPAAETFTRYHENDGLPNTFIYGILGDDHGELWLSTNRGLSRFDPARKKFRNYDLLDGVQSYEFNTGAYHRSKRTGEMFFGGINGVNIFHPDSVRDDPYVPPMVLTAFKKFDRPAPLEGEANEIKLDYNEDIFSFEFAALDFTHPEKNQYAYKMEGVDQDWVYCGNHREARYTHLAPGTYTFRVKGTNHDGVWNEPGASIQIMIATPFWMTWWAYALYVILGAAAVIGFIKRREHALKQRALALETAVTMRTAEIAAQKEKLTEQAHKLEELDHLKSVFFANISHEFRTPLTLILGPAEQELAKAPEENSRRNLRLIQNNAQRLLRLINQLLDLSRLESKTIQLKAGCGDLVDYLKGITMAFASLAESKQISLQFLSASEHIAAYFDPDKIEKIFYNLLSNAFKFTPAGGSVEVAVAVSSGSSSSSWHLSATATVKDTGVGIPAERLPYIFDRFYQVDSSSTREYEGSGIGLALVKELVELHHGTVTVSSEAGKGSTFTVHLPLGKDHLKPEEIVTAVKATRVHAETKSPNFETESPATSNQQRATSDEQPATGNETTILVVEDHADFRRLIRGYLEPDYRVMEAANGAEGWEIASAQIPDLIISDVMMPKMNGYDLCARLKADEKTSHIPVLLLTAKAGTADKLEGLQNGADDYLPKPFERCELQARLKNLIDSRRRLRLCFKQAVILKPSELAVQPADKVFLNKVLAAVERHLAEEEFDVDTLAREVALSRTQLNRKLRALTNQSVKEFIQSTRLQRAAELLRKKSGTVGEVAYRVGFGNHSYFAKCFREQFGKAPSEYAQS